MVVRFWSLLICLCGCTPIRPSDSEPRSVLPVDPEPELKREPQPQPMPRYPGPCRAEIDARGQENSARDGIAETVVTFEYDEFFRLAHRRTVTDTRGGDDVQTEAFTYDDEDRLATRRITTSRYVQDEWSHHDPKGRLARIDKDDRGKGKPRWRTEHKYDAEDRLTLRQELRLPSRRVGFKRAFVHDGDRLVMERVDNEGNGTWPLEIAIKYDDAGRVAQRIREWSDRPAPAEIEHFTYDDQSRLVRRRSQNFLKGSPSYSTSIVFEYDDAGNVLSKERIHDFDGRVTAFTAYAYDCWADAALPREDYPVLIPFEFRARLDQIPQVSF